ncbi:MAG: ATP-dependent Clp protease ATP-binding subunit [bacterium]|nr:ATP-dependent Clp protease ATP-binding subunit [bacterium]
MDKQINENYRVSKKAAAAGEFGLLYGKNYLVWKAHLKTAQILMRRLEKMVYRGLEGAAMVFGIIGVAALLWWLAENTNWFIDIDHYAFWQFESKRLLIFWLGIIALLYNFYRLKMEGRLNDLFKVEAAVNLSSTEKAWLDEQSVKNLKKIKRINVSRYLLPSTFRVVENTVLAAIKKNQNPSIKHLFVALLSDNSIQAVMGRLGIDPRVLKNKVESWIRPNSGVKKSADDIVLEPNLIEALLDSYVLASEFGNDKVSTLEIWLQCARYDAQINELLYNYDIDLRKVYNTIRWFSINRQQVRRWHEYRRRSIFKPGKQMDRAYTAVATPLLNQLGRDLTVAAKRGRLPFCVARDKEIEEVFTHLESGSCGVILSGPVGVGKYTVISGIAQRMVSEEVPAFMRDKRLVEIDVARLISGAGASESEGRLMAVMDEATHSGNIILAIRDIENMIGVSAGAEQSLDLSEVLVSAIDSRQLICFATVTDVNWSQYVERTALGNVMKKVDIEEPLDDQAIQIISSKIGALEGKHNVYFTYDALEASIKLTMQYMHDRVLPEKAIEMLELAAAQAKKQEVKVIDKLYMGKVISEATNIPVQRATAEEGKLLLNLEKKIHEQLIDQEEAVKIVASSMRRARAQLQSNKRPIANFLFLGPTGVGKTELAKTLSRIYFGGEEFMIRVDMSEYQHPDSITKLIGEPRGNKGYLTEAVRTQPFALLLLDEFEKANSNILNLFLQVMEDGRLTDGYGQTVDFTNTIIIATSNAGAVYIQEQVRASVPIEKIKVELLNDHLQKVLRPELINRFDGVVVFKPLSITDVEQITKLMLNKLAVNMEKQGIALETTVSGIKILAQQGYDPQFGARPLRRLLQDTIESQIANQILAGELTRRDTVIIDSNAQIQVRKGKIL